MLRRRWLCSCFVPAALAAQAGPAPDRPPDAAAWREDLEVLAAGIPRMHPSPFATLPRTAWDSAVAALRARLPGLSTPQTTVEFLRLVALLGDAHTNIEPGGRVFSGRRFPIELYQFEDGLFIRRAAPEHRVLVGARVLRIGRIPAESALALVAPLISHENEWWVKAWGPQWLTTPEVLTGLGLIADPARMTLELERGGGREVVTLPAMGRPAGGGHGGPDGEVEGWPSMREGPAPLWEQNPGRAFWWEWLPEARTLYVSYRAVAAFMHGQSNRQFWEEVFAEADRRPVERLVLDIRENTGGNGFLNRFPVQQILRRPALDRPDVLMVILGRKTFSAAQQLANDLDWWTQATFVGEPTGQRPSQYGDHHPLVLPRSGLVVNVSTVYHQGPNPFDRRQYLAPEIYAPLASADYRAGRDPALAAALAGEKAAGVVAEIEALVERGEVEAAERLLAEARRRTEHRFRPFEADLNAVGYRLLRGGQTARAIAVFEINTRAYPASANTYDSLGEALLAAGRREESIAAYRRALEVEPGFLPSVQALARLGLPPEG